MEQTNCVGLYLSRDSATAVVLSLKGSHPEISGCFTIAKAPANEEDTEQSPPLAAQVVQRLAAERLNYDEVTVSLDCALYTQHNMHSDFTDHKQIANTIAFDAEEALACDATDMAITFNITGTDENGANVSVFTSDRNSLDEILAELQDKSLDPATIEPDIVCLARYLQQYFTLPKESHPLFVVLSKESCYIIIPQHGHNAPLVRSFILGRSGDITSVLQREIPLTIASLNPTEPVNGILFAGETDDIDIKIIAERTGLDSQKIDLFRMADSTGSDPRDCQFQTAFAMAFGAALVELKRIKPCDFRQSFSPYQGKRLILQRSLRAISIFVTISMVALGIFFQSKVIKKKNYISQLDKNLRADYSAAMYGRKPAGRAPIRSQLNSAYNKVKIIKDGKGFGDESSVTAKLTFILEAMNASPKNIDLKITTVSISSKSMRVTGDTNSRASTLALFNSFKKHEKLNKTLEDVSGDNNRDKFGITLELKK